MKRLLIIGSTCVDVILRLDHLPTTGEDMHPVQRFAMGGCAFNVAQVPKAYDVDLRFVTPIGDHGVFSDFVRAHLDNAGFRGPITVPNSENGCCYCLVERSGERTFLSVHGIEYSFHAEYMDAFAGERFDYTYICGLEVEETTGGELVAWLETHPDIAGTVVYAPGPRGIEVDADRTERILAMHPILHLNEQEAQALAGVETSVASSNIQAVASTGRETSSGMTAAEAAVPSVESTATAGRADTDADPVLAAAQALHAKTQNMVIVTCGADGVLWISADGSVHSAPSVPSTVVDTIGAGDSHCGAVLTGLTLGWSEDDTMRFANQIASEVVAQEGGAYIRR